MRLYQPSAPKILRCSKPTTREGISRSKSDWYLIHSPLHEGQNLPQGHAQLKTKSWTTYEVQLTWY